MTSEQRVPTGSGVWAAACVAPAAGPAVRRVPDVRPAARVMAGARPAVVVPAGLSSTAVRALWGLA